VFLKITNLIYHCRPMEEGFKLNVSYKDKEYQLDTKFVRIGYVHQFHVSIEDSTLIFEFDEERNYRVIDAGNSTRQFDTGLIETIVEKISSLHR
jgi:hypothetical protein